QVTGGVGPDDGRARPTPTTNFRTATELGDNLVTYTELTGLLSPTVALGVATFNLPAGTGFHLPAGSTLKLSDAPAGPVGTVLTTRTSAIAVDLELDSKRIGGPCIVLEGGVTCSGDAGFSGGDFSLIAPYGTVIAMGGVNLSGGAATAALDAGSGGDLLFVAGQDLLIPYGSVSATGGSGDNAGGQGGDFTLTAGAALAQVHVWGALLVGGHGTNGNG